VKNVRTLNGVDEHRLFATATAIATGTLLRAQTVALSTWSVYPPPHMHSEWIDGSCGEGLQKVFVTTNSKGEKPSRTSAVSPPRVCAVHLFE